MKQNTPPLVLRSEMRTDSVPVDEHYSAEGYFYDNPILTRTGIFVYHLEDGSERRELRRPEDVFDPKSLASYEGKPIIITHDAQVIDKDNAHRERVGTILTPGQQDGETVRAKIVIDDPDAVKAVEHNFGRVWSYYGAEQVKRVVELMAGRERAAQNVQRQKREHENVI